MEISDPATLGMDPDRLRRIEPFLKERYLDSGRFKGTQLLVSRDGQLVHSPVAGPCGKGVRSGRRRCSGSHR